MSYGFAVLAELSNRRPLSLLQNPGQNTVPKDFVQASEVDVDVAVTVIDPAGIVIAPSAGTEPIGSFDPTGSLQMQLDTMRANATQSLLEVVQPANQIINGRYGEAQGQRGDRPTFADELLSPLGGIGLGGAMEEGMQLSRFKVRLLSPLLKTEQCYTSADSSHPNKVSVEIQATAQTIGSQSRAYAYVGLRLHVPALPNITLDEAGQQTSSSGQTSGDGNTEEGLALSSFLPGVDAPEVFPDDSKAYVSFYPDSWAQEIEVEVIAPNDDMAEDF